jgi:thioredoxin reductase
LSWRDGEAVSATGEKDAFEVALGDGSQHHARRLLLATGVSDTLPNIPGLQDLWGRSVLHCPCCHGYELQLGHIGVIATGPVSIHQAQMLPEWGRVTFNGALELDAAAAKDLAGRGVCVEATSIARLEGHADVVLVDDQRLAFAGLFTAPRKRRLRRLPNRSAVSSWKRHSARRSGRTTRRKLASLVYTRAVMRRGPRTRYRLPWATAHGPARSCIDR